MPKCINFCPDSNRETHSGLCVKSRVLSRVDEFRIMRSAVDALSTHRRHHAHCHAEDTFNASTTIRDDLNSFGIMDAGTDRTSTSTNHGQCKRRRGHRAVSRRHGTGRRPPHAHRIPAEGPVEVQRSKIAHPCMGQWRLCQRRRFVPEFSDRNRLPRISRYRDRAHRQRHTETSGTVSGGRAQRSEWSGHNVLSAARCNRLGDRRKQAQRAAHILGKSIPRRLP